MQAKHMQNKMHSHKKTLKTNMQAKHMQNKMHSHKNRIERHKWRPPKNKYKHLFDKQKPL